MNEKIQLCSDIIDGEDLTLLTQWLSSVPRLTKGDQTINFENKFANFLECNHAIYCNSGSSANLLITSALYQSGKLKNNKIIVPQISWSTTIFPVMQLGLQPILCDCDKDNLGLDVEYLKKLILKEQPSAIILVHVLGFDSSIKEIVNICNDNNILIIEDTCESLGSQVDNKYLGTFGLASSFSFYFGHHISTIEGGMVCTNDKDFADIVKMIRSHGWDRDLDKETRDKYRRENNISGIDSLYTFYYSGFNLRSTDLQAFLGTNQINKLEKIISSRQDNFESYKRFLDNKLWKPKLTNSQNVVSNMGYPLILKNRDEVYQQLNRNNIECRPLISGSMGLQPAWIKTYGECRMPNADIIDKYGMYLPNHQDLTVDHIERICKIVNQAAQAK
mgnify:CR=1 FL=1